MVESLVDALVVHLITLLSQGGQVGVAPDLLDDSLDLVLGQVSSCWGGETRHCCQEAAAVPGEVLEDEGGDHGGHDTSGSSEDSPDLVSWPPPAAT